jgi:hypothetical protein
MSEKEKDARLREIKKMREACAVVLTMTLQTWMSQKAAAEEVAAARREAVMPQTTTSQKSSRTPSQADAMRPSEASKKPPASQPSRISQPVSSFSNKTEDDVSIPSHPPPSLPAFFLSTSRSDLFVLTIFSCSNA